MFDVAVGQRAISHMGHIKMMGAVQPFISGAISKTVNMPETTTVEDIADAYLQAWKLGVKALAIYRDGSKTAQALRTDAGDKAKDEAPAEETAQKPLRRRMPKERQSITHKFSIGGHEGYITAGMYEDGTVGEIFLTDIGKEGSTLRGMMNAFATSISIALQYGVPLETLVRKFSYMRFDPEGATGNPEIPFAKSMPDYIMRWLASRFLDVDVCEELGILTPEVRARKAEMEALMRGDTAGPVAEPSNGGNGGGNGAREARGGGADGRAAGHPGEAAGPGPRPGLRPVRRDDAADGLVLHVQSLRQQHRLRLSWTPSRGAGRASQDRWLEAPAHAVVATAGPVAVRVPADVADHAPAPPGELAYAVCGRRHPERPDGERGERPAAPSDRKRRERGCGGGSSPRSECPDRGSRRDGRSCTTRPRAPAGTTRARAHAAATTANFALRISASPYPSGAIPTLRRS